MHCVQNANNMNIRQQVRPIGVALLHVIYYFVSYSLNLKLNCYVVRATDL